MAKKKEPAWSALAQHWLNDLSCRFIIDYVSLKNEGFNFLDILSNDVDYS